MDDDEGPSPIIIDNGSSLCRVGFAGEEAPRDSMSCVIGRPKYPYAMPTDLARFETYIGDAAMTKRGMLALSHPITRGVVTDWDGMERIWDYSLTSMLRVDPTEHNVIITDAALNPRRNRERIVETIFESFGVPGALTAMPNFLEILAIGRHCAMIIDIGEGCTTIAPIMGNIIIGPAVLRIDLGGTDLTEYLQRLLLYRGHRLMTSASREIVREIKQALCYVSPDYEYELNAPSNDLEATYDLPDGQVITLGEERFQCAEVLFQPSLIDHAGLTELVLQSLAKCAIDDRRDFLNNIFLAGGTSDLPGIAPRLERELTEALKTTKRIHVHAPPKDTHGALAWIGGSIAGSLSTTVQEWITRQEYDEIGPAIAHRKNFQNK